MLAILQWRRDSTTRRLAAWMAVAPHLCEPISGEFSVAPMPTSWSGWLETMGLFLLTILFVFAGTQRDDSQHT